MGLKQRILQFIEYKKIGTATFERNIGLANGTVYKMGENTRASTLDKISKVYPDLNINWVKTGEGEMLNIYGDNPTATDPFAGYKHDDKNKPDFLLLPVFLPDTPGNTNSKEFIPFINAKRGDIAIHISNDTMSPTFPPGTFIHIRKIKNWSEFIEFGQTYMIELSDGRKLIKEIRKGKDENHLLLVSHNKKYEDNEIDVQFIKTVWMVIAKYQKVVM